MSHVIASVNHHICDLVECGEDQELAKFLTGLAVPLWDHSTLVERAAIHTRVKAGALASGSDKPIYVTSGPPKGPARACETLAITIDRFISPKVTYSISKILSGELVDQAQTDPDRPKSLADVFIDEHYYPCLQALVDKAGIAHYGDNPWYALIELQPPTFFFQDHKSDDVLLECFCYIEAGMYVRPALSNPCAAGE